jgi:L-fuconolactonase
MRIDSHQHFWRLSRADYGWLTPDKTAIYRDYGPEDLEGLLPLAGIDRTVLVQAAPTEDETEFLLDLASAAPFVAGVVGWTDLTAPDAADRVSALAQHDLLVGLRPMIQDIEDDDWMLRDDLAPAIAAMAVQGLSFDALVLPRHLRNLRAFAERYPDLRIVLDHGGKPNIGAHRLKRWGKEIRALARDTGMVCKLSGMATEVEGWTVEDLRPYVEVLLEAFGPGRLMWGSNWPVVDLSSGYTEWLHAIETLVAALPATDQAAIFGGVAADFYGLAVRD